jgi:hypothetical protein
VAGLSLARSPQLQEGVNDLFFVFIPTYSSKLGRDELVNGTCIAGTARTARILQDLLRTQVLADPANAPCKGATI